MKTIIILIICLECLAAPLAAQKSAQDTYYKMGMEALALQDTSAAKTYFRRSILKYGDAASHFELANIYLVCEEPYCIHFGKEHLKNAVLKDPSNMAYRLRLAEVFSKISRYNAMSEYEKILELDNSCAPAWLALGRLKAREFNEYHKSANAESDFLIPLESFAAEDYLRAEHCLKQAIRLDPENGEAMFELAILYEDAGAPAMGIPYLEDLVELDPENERGYLMLGLLYYKSSRHEEAYQAYREALSLMSQEDRQDFIYYSAYALLEPVIKKDPSLKNDPDAFEKFLTVYWQSNDPLYLTDFNERLLEHYSRVTYANLRYSVPRRNIIGWKSDRGQTVLRYGEPLNRVRLRPQIDMPEVRIKTEVWRYPSGIVFGFDDEFMNGNFRFSVPPMGKTRFRSQFPFDSEFYFEGIKNKYHQLFTPKFKGPPIAPPFEIAQFASEDDKMQDMTDIYIYYGMEIRDSLDIVEDRQYAHQWGLFVMDKQFHPDIELRKHVMNYSSGQTIRLNDSEKMIVNAGKLRVPAREWNFAFEVIRDNDDAVATHHFRYLVKPYSTYSLSMSDIILATYISPFEKEGTVISRNGLHITPNPLQYFTRDMTLYLYFEIYNLRPSTDGISEYTQSLEIKRTDTEPGSFFGRSFRALLSTIGIGTEETAITLTSAGQSRGTEVPVYFQLDMSSYPPGDYRVGITIRDEYSGDTVRSETLVRWENLK